MSNDPRKDPQITAALLSLELTDVTLPEDKSVEELLPFVAGYSNGIKGSGHKHNPYTAGSMQNSQYSRGLAAGKIDKASKAKSSKPGRSSHLGG